jgi:hypothetical protein
MPIPGREGKESRKGGRWGWSWPSADGGEGDFGVPEWNLTGRGVFKEERDGGGSGAGAGAGAGAGGGAGAAAAGAGFFHQ